VPHVSVADHRAAVATLVGSAAVERVAIDHTSRTRRLADDVVAADDLPRFDCSAMDGYAVRPADPGQCTFPVVGDVPAGSAPERALEPGEAARVMTGARIPDGTVAVVPVEHTDAAPTGPTPDYVAVRGAVEPGRHIRRRGEDVAAGTVIAKAGSEVTPALIALARSAGCVDADMCRPTRVAVVATGAELTAPGLDPGPGGIHESNSHMVAALAEAAGCVVTRVESCSDETDRLRALLDELDAAADVDVVVTTGGVSAGAHEVVRQVCGPLETFRFVHLAMQPGGPQGLGRYGSTPVVCLPGTPVGAFVAFHVLLRPALDSRHGAPSVPARSAAYTGATRTARAGKVQFLTGVLLEDGCVTAPDARHLTAFAAGNVLIEVPEAVDRLVEGDRVVVHPV
jgi:molybdopterin molybdotransferase